MVHARFIILILCLTSLTAAAETDIDLAGVSERHVMIPMRDGAKLSAYLYMPPGDGPWPVLYEQRYSDLRGKPTRQALARLARHGYVVAAENFRGTHLSAGRWVGYRALGWGQLQDGYDTILIMDMIRRVRYREGFDREVLMTPGKVYRVAFDVGWLSQVFARGHRIRVAVAGTGAPFYEPQPNTGDAATIETPDRRIVADNSLHHGRPFASRVIAPLAAPNPAPQE